MEAAIEAYVVGTFDEVPHSVLDDVQTGKVALIALIKMLGAYLTSEDDRVRTAAVTLLSRVIVFLVAQSPAHTHPQLSRQVLRTLTTFFSEKLGDAVAVADAASRQGNDDTLVPASAPRSATDAAEKKQRSQSQMLVECIEALYALSSVGFEQDTPVDRHHFGGEEARMVSHALFASLDVRTYTQSLRYAVYRLLDSLVARNRAGLAYMRRDAAEGTPGPPGSGFIEGYTRLIAGEKDPRNLLTLFSITKVLLLEWEIDAAEVEGCYNVVFCYFPITFRPPPDDPYHITPEMLKTALRACISASPAFAPLGLPVLLEKLSASGGSAKVDVLQTLAAALPVYGHAATKANADELWSFLKLDILQATDDESAAWAQTTLTTILRILYEDHPDEVHTGLASTVLNECLTELAQPSKALAKTSMKLVQSLVEATPSTSTAAIHAVLGLLLGKLDEGDEDESSILALLAGLLDLCQRVYAHEHLYDAGIAVEPTVPGIAAPAAPLPAAPAAPEQPARRYETDGRPLHPFHDPLFTAMTKGVERRTDAAALHGLVMLVHIPSLLSADEVDYATRCIQPVLLAPDADESLRKVALSGLERIGRVHAHSIEAYTLPYLLSMLPYTLPPSPRLDQIRLALGALARLCTSPALFHGFVVRVCALLASACAVQNTDGGIAVGYATALLATLQVCLEEKRAQQHTDVATYATQLPPRLVSILAEQRADQVGSDVAVVQHVCEILALLLPTLDAAEQASLAVEIVDGVAPDTDRLPIPDPDAPAGASLSLVAALVVAMKKDAALPRGDALAWITAAYTWLVQHPLRTPDAFAAQSVCFLLCALANKYAEEQALRGALPGMWTPLVSDAPLVRRVQGVRAWAWMARALAARGSDMGASMLDRVRTELLPLADMGPLAAAAMHVFAVHDDMLTRANGFQIRLLYKQRLLDQFLPQLVADYRLGSAAQPTYLIAIATLLPALPEATLAQKVVGMLPLLLHTLRIPDARARTSAADALHTALQELPVREENDTSAVVPSALHTAVQDQLSALVPALLANVQQDTFSTPATRIAAMHVLGALVPRLAHDTLLPYRRDVLRALGTAGQGIDDPRRAVRLQAVDARDVWFRISTLD